MDDLTPGRVHVVGCQIKCSQDLHIEDEIIRAASNTRCNQPFIVIPTKDAHAVFGAGVMYGLKACGGSHPCKEDSETVRARPHSTPEDRRRAATCNRRPRPRPNPD